MPTFSYTSGNPNNLVAGNNASMADIQGPFTDLRTFVNGGIGTSNLSSTAGITETQLASAGSGLAKGAFHGYRNAALTQTAGTAIPFDTELFDISGWFDVANGRYTPQVAGYYRLSWAFTSGTTLASGNYLEASLYKNGIAGANLVARGPRGAYTGGTAPVVGGSGITPMNGSTDYVTIVLSSDVASHVAVAGAGNTYFMGELIGRA